MQKISRTLGCFILVISVVLVFPCSTYAHNSACAHIHVPEGDQTPSTCDDSGTCEDGNGNCIQRQFVQPDGSFDDYCVCKIEFSYNTLALYGFEPVVAGLPEANSVRTYEAIVSDANAFQINYNDTVLSDFTQGISALEGHITFSFGSFTEPTNIPVQLVDVFLQGPSVSVLGFPTGPSLLRLPYDSEPPAFSYNAKTGVMEPAGGGSITLATDNQLDFDLSTRTYLSIGFDVDGNMTLFTEMATETPTIPQHANPERISVGQPGRLATGLSSHPSISTDGRFLAFASQAVNLVSHDGNSANDIFVRDRVTGQTERVSVNTSGIEGNGHSFHPSISSDGTLVVFSSAADNLVPGDFNNSFDVFVHNRQNHETARISMHTSTAESNGVSRGPTISANGRYVTFTSSADNLVDNDTNNVLDIFVHDLQTHTTSRVSVNTNGDQASNSSDTPAISADGRYIVFTSFADNLVPTDGNFELDIFLHDRDTGTTTRISVSTGGVEHDGFSAFDPSISADGRYIAFSSDADNLDPSSVDNNEVDDIFVHDQQLHTTTRISINGSNVGGNGEHLGPVISADSQFVAYTSDSDNLAAGDTNGWRDVFVFNRNTSETTRVSVDTNGVQGNDDSGIFTSGLAISGDGNLVFFESLARNLITNDTNSAQDIFVRNRQMNTTSLASLSSLPAQADGRNFSPASSFDGSVIAFSSLATNLVDGDNNAVMDVFVRDRNTGSTTRISVNAIGDEANGASDAPALSDNGQLVAYDSFATNLVDSDTNDQPDIFLYDRGTGAVERVNVSSAGVQADDMSFNPSLSADGMKVAFISYATNLIDNDNNAIRDVFVRDRKTNQTMRVSIHTDGSEGNDDSGETRFATDTRYISGDGRFVVFESDASNLVDNDGNIFADIFIRDLSSNTTERISVSTSGQEADEESASPSISADGRYVAFTSLAGNLVSGDGNLYWDIFLRDRDNNTTTRISLGMNGSDANGDSGLPSISADGRIISFVSSASNLVPDDGSPLSDIFTYDRQTGITKRNSIDHDGNEGNRPSTRATISPNGQQVTFITDASNLISDDTNGMTDLYVHDRNPRTTPGDFDHDGDIDNDDSSEFFSCITGPDVSISPECVAADFDFDHDADLKDVSLYLNAFTGDAPGGGTISGSIIANTTNAHGISNGFVDQPDVMVKLMLRGTTLDSTRTDANGQYQFDHVVEGSYDIQAVAPDGRFAMAPIEVATEKITTMNFGIIPQRPEGIFASYAGISIDTATMSDPDLDSNGIIDLHDLRTLRFSIDPDDAEALELAELYFGRIVMVTDLHFQAHPTDMGGTFMLGDGLAMGHVVSGVMTTLLGSTGDPTSALFTITDYQGVIDTDKIGLLDFQADLEQNSSIILDLDNGRVLKGIAYIQLSGGLLTSPQDIFLTLTQGFFALSPGGFEFYHFANIHSTLAIDFPVFGGLAMLQDCFGKTKADVGCGTAITLQPGVDPRCDFGGKACATENLACSIGGSCRKCVTQTRDVSGGHKLCTVCYCVK